MITKQKNIITITIDDEELQDYYNYYFRKYPKRRKKYIDKPVPPSLNVWTPMKRMQKNELKQHWNNFMVWLIQKYEIDNMKIQRCNITYIYTFPTKHRRDTDNYTPKFINDGLVNSGFLQDDSYFNIEVAKFLGKYEKGVYQTDIIVEILE